MVSYVPSNKAAFQSLGSISSRFVSPRSLPHTTAGSLVYPLYFLTNHRDACMGDISADEFSSIKCVLERFYIEKFREIQEEAIVNMLEGKACKIFSNPLNLHQSAKVNAIVKKCV